MAENIAAFSTLILREIESESDSSESDQDWELVTKQKRSLRPRMKNVELLIELYSDEEFKSHFRLDISFVIYFLIYLCDNFSTAYLL